MIDQATLLQYMCVHRSDETPLKMSRSACSVEKKTSSTEQACMISRDGQSFLEVELEAFGESLASSHSAVSKLVQSDQLVSILLETKDNKFLELHAEVGTLLQLLDRTNAECLAKVTWTLSAFLERCDASVHGKILLNRRRPPLDANQIAQCFHYPGDGFRLHCIPNHLQTNVDPTYMFVAFDMSCCNIVNRCRVFLQS